MWRLGLPCLTSATSAYARVADLAGADVVCKNNEDWIRNINMLLTDTEYAYNQVIKGQDYVKKYHDENTILKKWDDAVEFALDRT
jgi:hypothetical protein